MTAVASAAPDFVKRELHPKRLVKPPPNRPVQAEQQQQHIANRNGRQNEGR